MTTLGMQLDTMLLPIVGARDSDIEYLMLPLGAAGGSHPTTPNPSPNTNPNPNPSSSGSSYVDTINSYRNLYGITPIVLDAQLEASSKKGNADLNCTFNHDSSNNFSETLSYGVQQGIASMHDNEIGCYDPVAKAYREKDTKNPNKRCDFSCGGNCGKPDCTCYGHVQIMTSSKFVGCDTCGPKSMLRCQYR